MMTTRARRDPRGRTEDEQEIVRLVREFVDREVKPVVRELDHANTCPEKLIEQMKQLGVFGLAIPEPWGGSQVSAPCYALITEELARGWMSLAGAMGGHSVVATLVASRALGVGRAALEDALRYAQEREAFGKPIWQHQSISNYLADMVTKLTAARQLVLHAALIPASTTVRR